MSISDDDLLDQAVAFAEMWGTPDNWQQVRDAFTTAIKRDRATRTDDSYRTGWQDAMNAAPGMQAAAKAFRALTYPVSTEIDSSGYALRADQDSREFAAEILAEAISAAAFPGGLLTAYEMQVLLGTTISGCNMSPDRVFDLKAAWLRLHALGLIDRTDGLTIATDEGRAIMANALRAAAQVRANSEGNGGAVKGLDENMVRDLVVKHFTPTRHRLTYEQEGTGTPRVSADMLAFCEDFASSLSLQPVTGKAPPSQALRDRVELLERERDAYKLSAEYESGDADASERLKHILDEHSASKSRVEVLEAALKPFADAADNTDANDDYSSASIWEHPCALDITIGDLRRARRAALNTGEPKQ